MRLLIPGFSMHFQHQRVADLAERYQLPLVTVDALLASSIRTQTDLGNRAKTCLESGQLIPDRLILKFIEERITEVDARQGWILAGFPRNIGQAQSLNALLLDIDQLYDAAIYFGNVRAPLPASGQRHYPDYLASEQVMKTPLGRFYSRLNLLVKIETEMSWTAVDRALSSAPMKMSN